MLFIPISAAAVRAAASAGSDKWRAASATTASRSLLLRVAMAEATDVPQICCSLRCGEVSTLPRLMRRSLAQSGMASRMAPRTSVTVVAVMSSSCGLQGVLAFLPVAQAELIGLEGVEQAQRLLRIAPDIEVVDRDVADDALRIDDEGGAQRHARPLVEDAERRGQLALDVAEPRKPHLGEILAGAPP